NPPTSSVVLTSDGEPTDTVVGFVTLVKPSSSNVTVYSPAGSPGRTYTPFSSVVVERVPCNDGDAAVTATPGSTSPSASRAVPCREPVCTPWANATVADRMSA